MVTKSMLNRDLFREIKKTRSRFFSILALVVIAVCFLFGLRMAAPDMTASMDAYLDAQSLMDVHVISTLGLTQEDVDALAETEGTEAAEGFYSVDAMASGGSGQDTLVVKAISLGADGMNAPTVTEGRLPEAADECLVEENLLTTFGISVGDTITLDTGSGAYADSLKNSTFTVVGVGKSPLYVSLSRGTSTLGNGSVGAVISLTADAYALDYYTDIYIRVTGADALNAYEDAYEDLVAEYTDRVEAIRAEREEARTAGLKADAQQEVDDAWAEYYDAEADANAELDDALQELTDARATLDDGWTDYQDGQTQLADARQEIADGEAELVDAHATLVESEAEYADGKAEYEDGLAQYRDGLAEYQSGYSQYLDALAQYKSGEAQYEEALKTYEESEAAYADGLQQYEDGEAAYAEGYQQYLDGEAEYASGLAEYEAGEAAYAEGYQQYLDGEAAYAEGYQAYLDGLAQYEALEAQVEQLRTVIAGGLDEETVDKICDGVANGFDEETINTVCEALRNGLDEDTSAQVRSLLLSQGISEDAADALCGLLEDGLSEEAVEKVREALSTAHGDAAADALRELLSEGLGEDAADTLLASLLEQMEESKAQLDAAAETLAESRAQLDAAKATLDESRAQLDAGKATLDESRAQLDEAKATLAEKRALLDETAATLAESRVQLDEGKALLERNGATLSDGKAQLDASAVTLSTAKTTLDESEAQLVSAAAQLSDARSELDSGWAEYQDGIAQLDDARQEVADGEAELVDAYAELTDGEAAYADGLVEYADGKAEAEAELADARAEIEDGQRAVDEIADAEWYVLDRTANTGFASYQQDAQRMTKLATLFPTVFFLVAALVCLTAMTRMVEEQRVQIGGLKALGYSKLDIARKYVGYGLLASVVGGLIGLVLGGIGIPWVIVTCWKVMYDYPGVTLTFSWPTALACMLAAVGCCTIAVLAAALNALRATPAELMRPRAPEPGKRVWLEYLTPIWKRMSFTQKVTARNLFRYQKRFWMTVIGIAGCTGLMITGFGLRDSIMDVVDLQFGQVSTYSAIVYMADDADDGERAALTEALDGEAELTDYALCSLNSVTLESSSYSLDGYLLAVEDAEDLEGFWNFRDRTTGEAVSMTDDGALISEKTAELLGLSVGDSITVTLDNVRVEIPISGIVENYVQHYLYLTDDVYAAAFGEQPEISQVLLSYPETADWEGLGSDLMELDGVSGIYYIKESKETIRSQLNGVYPAVIIIISAAAALAFVVLYNLSSINITERLRELATLKVLGFRDGELRNYVFRENIVLTLIGMALGLVMGKFFHAYLITTVEVELVMFGRDAHLSSYLLSLALTFLFALLVNFAAGRKLRKIDMVESLKTVE